MNIINFDYTCFKYENFNFLLIKIPDKNLTDLANATTYDNQIGNFLFDLNTDLFISNENDNLVITNNVGHKFYLPNISNNIILDWSNQKRFIFKFFRSNVNISTLDNSSVKDIKNIIGVLQVN